MDWMKVLFPLNIDQLSKKERKAFVLLYGIVPSIFDIIVFSRIYIDYRDINALLIAIPFMLLFLGIASIVAFHEWIVKKVEYSTGIRLGNSYQYITTIGLFFLPGLISGGLMIGYFINVFLGIGICLAFAIPIVGQFLRRNIFNDNSCILGEEIVVGYPPDRYALLNIIIGLYGYVNGFRSSGWDALIWIIIVFAFQLILLFPDKVNRVFPLEIRTKRGCFAFLGSVIILFLIFIVIFQSILLKTGVQIGNLSIKNLFYWIIGGILAIIFLKKSKDMWE